MRILILCLLLSGCCSWCPEKTREIYVKTGCLPPPVVVAPALKTDKLLPSATNKDVVEAYVFDNLALFEYSNQLLQALGPYKQCQPAK